MDETLKISDFGVAEQIASYRIKEMNVSAYCGTHQFLAPEIVDGHEYFDGPKSKY
jgi:hypothetical protein